MIPFVAVINGNKTISENRGLGAQPHNRLTNKQVRGIKWQMLEIKKERAGGGSRICPENYIPFSNKQNI